MLDILFYLTANPSILPLHSLEKFEILFVQYYIIYSNWLEKYILKKNSEGQKKPEFLKRKWLHDYVRNFKLFSEIVLPVMKRERSQSLLIVISFQTFRVFLMISSQCELVIVKMYLLQYVLPLLHSSYTCTIAVCRRQILKWQ